MTKYPFLSRRFVPPIISIIISIAMIVPVWGQWPREILANKVAQELLTIGFAIKAAVFFQMRRRMGGGSNYATTTFGQSLTDWFLALILTDVSMAGLFAWFWLLNYRDPLSIRSWEVAVIRGPCVGAIVYCILTAIGCLWEMSRVEGRLVVRVPIKPTPETVVVDRRRGRGRRSTDVIPVAEGPQVTRRADD